MSAGFITAAAISKSPNNDWIQVTGCIDPSKMSLAPDDDGGQFDVRFPNGAQCVYGGYAASFIQQLVPVHFRSQRKVPEFTLQSRTIHKSLLPPLLCHRERPDELQFASGPSRLQRRNSGNIRFS